MTPAYRGAYAGAARGGGRDAALSVSQLTELVNGLLRSESALNNVWVRGEISTFRPNASGHIYFSLKDSGGLLECVMWRLSVQRLLFRPEAGMQVLARGSIGTYGGRSIYQLTVEELQPDGQGAEHLALEQLKARLLAEGLLESARKRALPAFPRRVAVITSLTGSVVRDICVTLARSRTPVDVVLVNAQVQGDAAVESVVYALRQAAGLPGLDAIILARGGGSAEDLRAFNAEALVRAVAAAPVPVISAVGHETDFTLCDLVADHRAPTPTAAAEYVAARRDEQVRRMQLAGQRAAHLFRRQVEGERRHLDALLRRPALARPEQAVQSRRDRVLRLEDRGLFALQNALRLMRARLERVSGGWALSRPLSGVEQRRQHLDDLQMRLLKAAESAQTARSHRLDLFRGKLETLSPLATLARGYALVTDEGGQSVASISQARPGQHLNVRLRDGELECWVTRVGNEHGESAGKRPGRRTHVRGSRGAAGNDRGGTGNGQLDLE